MTETAQDQTPVYELGFHIVPTVVEDGVGGVVEQIRKKLEDAEIISERSPQKMHFAYTIERTVASKREKYNEGYFGFIKFATEREVVPELQKTLTNMPDVLRFILVETTREEPQTQPRRAVFSSDRLQGEVLQRPAVQEKRAEVSEEELDKSLEALVQ